MTCEYCDKILEKIKNINDQVVFLEFKKEYYKYVADYVILYGFQKDKLTQAQADYEEIWFK